MMVWSSSSGAGDAEPPTKKDYPWSLLLVTFQCHPSVHSALTFLVPTPTLKGGARVTTVVPHQVTPLYLSLVASVPRGTPAPKESELEVWGHLVLMAHR
jgi:hypothetical protein